MKHTIAKLTFCLCLLALSVFAQLGIKIQADKQRYLKYEPINVTVTVRNNSGNTLVFGKDQNGKAQGRLLFFVATQSGTLVHPVDPYANPMDGLIFSPGQIRQLKLVLNSFYDLQGEDYYKIYATIEHRRIPKHAIESNQVNFQVLEGTTLKTIQTGLPARGDNTPIRTITATLLRFDDTGNDIYCLRVDDDERVYGTFRLGPYIQASKPQMDVDENSSIHILIQIRPRIYKYNVFSFIHNEVKLRIEKYFVPDVGVPTLSRAAGYLKVLYAKQAVEGVDFKYDNGEKKDKK